MMRQSSTSQLTALEGFDNCRGVADGAACIVDQEGALLHLADGLLVEHVPAQGTASQAESAPGPSATDGCMPLS